MGRQSAHRLQNIYAKIAGGVIVLNAAGRILDANATAARILGTEVAELRGALLSQSPWETAYPAGLEWPGADSPITLALRTKEPVLDVAMHIVRPNGELQRLRVDIMVFLDARGEVDELVIHFVDLTGDRRVEEQHRTVEARYRALVERLPNITYMFTPGDASEMLYMSPQIETILGYSAEEWQSNPDLWISLLHPDDRERVVTAFEQAVKAGAPVDLEYRSFSRDGRIVWLSDKTMLIHDDAGRPWYFQGLMTDITAYKTMEQTLHHQAMHDALTRLPNRILLQDRLEQGLHAAWRHGTPLALFLIDLNRFKEVNDALGHHCGDHLLQQVSERFQAIVRASDTVARLGGDEFAMLLPSTDGILAQSLAARVAEALEEPFVVDGQHLDVGAGIGIALFPDHGADAATLLRCADIAMYDAKRAGGYAVYDAARDQENRTRVALARDLHHALSRHELALVYQPQVDLDDNRLAGVEALLRWRHPRHGFISPEVFIPLAEQTGVIGALTKWVVEQTLRQCRAWRRAGLYINVAINLSVRVLHDAQLPETLAELLRRYAIAPSRVTLEVTESSLMTDPAMATAILSRLDDLGVRISIDDFGTGYSSLAYLKQLPVDEIKIDKSFIQGLHAQSRDAPLISSIVAMAHALGLDVVAEGVETPEACEMLASLDGLLIQGYHISRPLPAADLQRWTAKAFPRTDDLSA